MGCSLSSVSVTENMEEQDDSLSSFSVIPRDLLIDILSRNPTRSIARFRCVSKKWESILRGPDFTELFLRRSSSQPRLLFTFVEDKSHLFSYSTPQPQNQDENSSLVAVVDRHKSFFAKETNRICHPVNGLVCTKNQEWKDTVPLICNLSTGQSISFPRLKTGKLHEFRYFGYDPIGKQFKVLSMVIVISRRYQASAEHHILTLGKRESLWREIGCSESYKPLYKDGICINGVLYYRAAPAESEEISIIVCFDVRSEKFSFVNTPEGLERGKHSTLINYKGKLCVLHSKRGIDYNEITDGSTGFLKLWVLEDLEKNIWSTKMYQLPSLLDTDVYIAGMTSTGEFVLSPELFSGDPFYVFFYDPEKNSIIRVEIQGIERRKPGKFHTFIDYIEDVKLM